jgi:hypothetical protein
MYRIKVKPARPRLETSFAADEDLFAPLPLPFARLAGRNR